MKELPPIGSKARVAPVESVASYAHYATGTVNEHRYSVAAMGDVAVLIFDEPLPRHWSVPLLSLGLRADQIEEIKTP